MSDAADDPANDDPANIADLLTLWAGRTPGAEAIVRVGAGRAETRTATFAELDRRVDAIAAGLREGGVGPGDRIALMVRDGLEFVTLAFALFRVGAVVVLIDPGMGVRSMLRCLASVRPEGFVAIRAAHVARLLSIGKFPHARKNVCVGPGLPGVRNLREVERFGAGRTVEPFRDAGAEAAIIFTSGSTGPAKGVVYEHRMFAAQVRMIRDEYGIEPGTRDLPCFPLFGLFNVGMGVTSVIPPIDMARPAKADPAVVVETINKFECTSAYASPAIWRNVTRLCRSGKGDIKRLKQIVSAGAPVPPVMIRQLRECLAEDAEIHTPYGATECLPVTTISGTEIATETGARTERGHGTCVGRPFAGVDIKIIEPADGSIDDISKIKELPAGEIGEVIVRSVPTTRNYFERPDATADAKIADGDGVWHRMGDMGYFDDAGRLWFCGRKSHVVRLADGPLYPVMVEGCIIAEAAERTGEWTGSVPIVARENGDKIESVAIVDDRHLDMSFDYIVDFDERWLVGVAAARDERGELVRISSAVVYSKPLPVDKRHNIKIRREHLSEWVSRTKRRPAEFDWSDAGTGANP